MDLDGYEREMKEHLSGIGAEALKETAKILGDFREELTANGFTEVESFELIKSWWNVSLAIKGY